MSTSNVQRARNHRRNSPNHSNENEYYEEEQAEEDVYDE